MALAALMLNSEIQALTSSSGKEVTDGRCGTNKSIIPTMCHKVSGFSLSGGGCEKTRYLIFLAWPNSF